MLPFKSVGEESALKDTSARRGRVDDVQDLVSGARKGYGIGGIGRNDATRGSVGGWIERNSVGRQGCQRGFIAAAGGSHGGH